jgi:hypothetical protein
MESHTVDENNNGSPDEYPTKARQLWVSGFEPVMPFMYDSTVRL